MSGKAVQVAHAAVVGQDAQLRGGEEAGHEAAGLGVRALRGAQLGPGAEGGGGAVVAVGDEGARDGLEGGEERGGVAHAPDGVADAVRGDEVAERGLRGLGLDEGVDRGEVLVAEEDLAGVGARLEDVARAVVLLVLARLLVAQDRAGGVVVDRAAGDDGRLRRAAHRLAVEVERRRLLADEAPVADERRERPLRLRVDRRGVRVGAVGQVDLGAHDVQERERVAGGERAGLVGVDDVVRERGDPRGELGRRGAEGGEGADVHG